MRATDRFIHIDSIYTAFSVRQEADFSFAGESHGFWEMVYVIDGTVGIMAGSRIYHLQKNEVIFHKPYEFHRIWSAEGSTPAYLVISFDLSGTGKVYFENLTLKPNGIQNRMLDTLAAYTRENEAPSNNPLDHAGQNGPGFSCFVYLFDLLLCSFAKSSEPVPVSKSENALLFEKVVSYMESNLDQSLSVAQLSAYASVSSSTLKRIFLKYASVSIHRYFQALKLEKAKAMLRGGAPVSRTAKALGFSSQNNFSLTFKKAVGLSPLQYRNGEPRLRVP